MLININFISNNVKYGGFVFKYGLMCSCCGKTFYALADSASRQK